MFKVEVKTNQMYYTNKRIIDPEQSWTNVLGKSFTSRKEAEIEAAHLEHNASTYLTLTKGLKLDLRITEEGNTIWSKQIVSETR